MKKQYHQPQMEVIQLKVHHMLAASPSGWGGELGAREYDLDMDSDED